MCSNRLQLNTAKTEVLWCATSRRQHQIPREPTRVGTDFVQSARSIRDLGIYLRLRCFHEGPCFQNCVELFQRTQTDPLHSSICHTPGSSVPRCVCSFVSTRLWQRSTRRFAYPRMSRLLSIQNAGARLIFSADKYDHVSSLLRDLHWLRAPQRIDYKIAVLVVRCLHGRSGVPVMVRVIVVGHVSRPDVEAVHCRQPSFPDRRCTSLEHSVAERSLIQFFIYTVFQKISPSFCLRYNFFDPNPILIILGWIVQKNNYNKTCTLLSFTTVLCTLTTACSMSYQFWLIFTMENVKFKQKTRELKIKLKHWQNNSNSYKFKNL